MVTLSEIQRRKSEIQQSMKGDRGTSFRQKRDAVRDLERAERLARRGVRGRPIQNIFDKINRKSIFGGRKNFSRGRYTGSKAVIIQDSKGRVTSASRKVLAKRPDIIGQKISTRQGEFLTGGISGRISKKEAVARIQRERIGAKDRARKQKKILDSQQKLREGKGTGRDVFLGVFGKTKNIDLKKDLTPRKLKTIKSLQPKYTGMPRNQSKDFLNYALRNSVPLVVNKSGSFQYLSEGGLLVSPKLKWSEKVKILGNQIKRQGYSSFGKELISTGIEWYIKSPARGYKKIITSKLWKELKNDVKGVTALFYIQENLNDIKKGKGSKKNIENINKGLKEISKINKGASKELLLSLAKDNDVRALGFVAGGITLAIGAPKVALITGTTLTGVSLVKFIRSPNKQNLIELSLMLAPTVAFKLVKTGGKLFFKGKGFNIDVNKILKNVKSKKDATRIINLLRKQVKIYYGKKKVKSTNIKKDLKKILAEIGSGIGTSIVLPAVALKNMNKRAKSRAIRLPSRKKTSQKGSTKVIEQTLKPTESGKKFIVTKERIITKKKGSKKAGKELKEVKIKRTGLGKIKRESTFKRTESGRLIETNRDLAFIPSGSSKTPKKLKTSKQNTKQKDMSNGMYMVASGNGKMVMYTARGSVILSKASQQVQQFAKLQQKGLRKGLSNREQKKFNTLKNNKEVQKAFEEGQSLMYKSQTGVRGIRTDGRQKIREKIIKRLLQKQKSRQKRGSTAKAIIKKYPEILTKEETKLLKNIYTNTRSNNIPIKLENNGVLVGLDYGLSIIKGKYKNYIDIEYKIIGTQKNKSVSEVITTLLDRYTKVISKLKQKGQASIKNLQKLQQKLVSNIKNKIKVKVIAKKKYKYILSPVIISDLVNSIQIKQSENLQLKNILNLKTKQIKILNNKNIKLSPKTIKIPKTPPKAKIPPPKTKTPPPKTKTSPPKTKIPPPPPFIAKIPKLTWKSKPKKGYSLLADYAIRIKGKKRVFKVGKTPNRALKEAIKKVDKSTARSLELIVSGVGKSKDIKKPALLRKFRTRKGKDPRVLIFVEKTKYAIDSAGEKRQLKKARRRKK